VSIDDPRAVFVFRFYVEVEKNGKDLDGYQNPQCHAYRLTYDNNGDAWRFTSNFQVISVVQMLRHDVLPGQIFVMRKDELKTVRLKFDDMLGAGGAGPPDDGSDGGVAVPSGRRRGRGRGPGRGCVADGSAPSQR
jgi:hypothetical protein